MTPLAAYLAKQLVARQKHRDRVWRDDRAIADLRQRLDGVHFFEVTGCLSILEELAHSVIASGNPDRTSPLFEDYTFLPAPKTWIEWRHYSGNRVAFGLTEVNENIARVELFWREGMAEIGMASTKGDETVSRKDAIDNLPDFLLDKGRKDIDAGLLALAQNFLILINSPRIIGRRQHMPNAGLERRLTRGLGVGRFPLQAWTEVILEIHKPVDVDDGEPHEAHLTGRRALHFVRKHVRIKDGRLEYVTSHWRGDPALGIKQSRYIVTR